MAGPPEEQEGQQGAEAPEGGWGWVVMLAAMWCNGAVFGIQNSCGVLFVSMLREFGSQDDKQLVFKTGDNAACFLFTKSPESENRRSHGTVVAGVARYLRAKCAKDSYVP